MSSVTLQNVNKFYDKNIQAVKDANLVIPDKEFVVLVGPSGCGKSTLLRMIAGLEDISEGEIKIDDKIVNNVSPKDRDIAMVFQNYALYPHMTVFDNMAFGLKIRKFDTVEIEKRVNDAAELLDLTPYLTRKPKALSGGQRQRVAVGRAIVRKPKVFLFDEPLSNLDAKLRVQMRIEINKLHQKLGTTMVYVTHDQVEAMTMGDRIVVMKEGIIQQIDTPLNLYNYPNNLFVAGFIGSPAMNFFKGELYKNGQLKFINESFELSLNKSTEALLKSYNSHRIILGIRPEHLELSIEDTEFKATVELIEPMGSETYVYFNIPNYNFTMRVAGSCTLNVGQKISLKLYPDKIQIFDPETQASIKKDR